jgi:hypothetical protein
MGFEIIAYYDIDQKDIEQFILANNIDRNSWKQKQQIVDFFRAKYLDNDTDIDRLVYFWNEQCKLHEIFDGYGTNFIRRDERFDNRRFQKYLADEIGRPFPECLKNINFSLHTSEDAIEIADELEVFFADDDPLMCFASWLRQTAKYCSTYELSY